MNEYTSYLDLFFNCNDHSNKRECLEGILKKVQQDCTAQFKDDLQSIIDFVDGTDSEVRDFVKEIKASY